MQIKGMHQEAQHPGLDVPRSSCYDPTKTSLYGLVFSASSMLLDLLGLVAMACKRCATPSAALPTPAQ